MAIMMKERPKVGDRVEFKYRGVLTGKVHAVAETGVHFMIEMPKKHRLKYRLIGLSTIIRILPKSTNKGEECQ